MVAATVSGADFRTGFGGSVMGNIVLLFACLAIGMILRKSGRVPDNAHTSLNAFIIHVSLPALTLLQIHRIALAPI